MIYNKDLKREIPVGWEVKKLSEECKILLGGTPDTSKNEYWQGNIHWLNSGIVICGCPEPVLLNFLFKI